MFDAIISTVLEVIAYILSKIVGKTFNIDAKEARRIGELSILVALVSAVTLITIIYS